MRRLTVALLFVALGAGLTAPSAAAEPLRANVVSSSPSDIDKPDVPVSIVFRLYEPEVTSPDPTRWGKPIEGVRDVKVVVRGRGQVHRFPAEDLGGGRYRTDIVFPDPGGWEIRVSYGAGHYGPGDEILLGKGAICIAADCVGPQPAGTAPAASTSRGWTTVVVVAAAVLLSLALLVAGLVRFGALGRRRRMAPTA